MADLIAVVSNIAAHDPIIPGSPAQLTIAVNVELKPVDGSQGRDDSVSTTLSVNSTANQWRTALLNAVTAYAANAPGIPGAPHTVVRLIGFVDLVTVVP